MRSFPEMYAVMTCPFESCTLNVAFGSASMILPSVSMTSSFDTDISSDLKFRPAAPALRPTATGAPHGCGCFRFCRAPDFPRSPENTPQQAHMPAILFLRRFGPLVFPVRKIQAPAFLATIMYSLPLSRPARLFAMPPVRTSFSFMFLSAYNVRISTPSSRMTTVFHSGPPACRPS